MKHSKPARQRIVLLDLQGQHHETPNALQSDKVQALVAFRELGKSDGVVKKRFTLDDYIIYDPPLISDYPLRSHLKEAFQVLKNASDFLFLSAIHQYYPGCLAAPVTR